jgi:hydroxyacylglutathione hydrolase
MIFKRFYDDNLAQASYMIACEKTRDAIVVDPNRDVAFYTRAAGADRLHIAHITETHVHADFVSGARALADASGATLYLSSEGAPEWSYSNEALESAEALKDGSELLSGSVRLRAMHTPGHTPEHLTFLVSDLERGPDPVGALTGDFLFVGDVGRPDLLERALGVTSSAQQAARDLFQSIQKIRLCPDYLQIWPGHGAGSACGKSLGAMPQSTLGYEKLFNWALADMSEEEFVERVLEDQPVPPRYFATMKKTNRVAAALSASSEPGMAGFEEMQRALLKKAVIVDCRPAQKFATGHVPGTLNVPLGKSFLNWMGALVPADQAFYLIAEADSEELLRSILRNLSKIGLGRVAGIFPGEMIHEWKVRRGSLETVSQLDVGNLQALTGEGGVQVVDVRNPDEWSHGHLPGAIPIPLAALPDSLDRLDPSRPVVIHCMGGGRSSIATSFLQARGVSNVSNLAGGYEAWVAAGLPTESPRKPVRPARRKNK